MTSAAEKVKTLSFQPDPTFAHVMITDASCCQSCRTQPCVTVCPAAVFQRTAGSGAEIAVHYRQCVECGACRLACPVGAIALTYPNGGFGVIYRQG